MPSNDNISPLLNSVLFNVWPSKHTQISCVVCTRSLAQKNIEQ